MRFNKRTDHVQNTIVKDLRALGIQVVITNGGFDHPDLLCGYKGVWTLLEIKNPLVTNVSKGTLTRGQMQFIVDARGPIGVATNLDEAQDIVKWEGGITEKQKENIIAWLIRNPDQQTLSVSKFREMLWK